MPHKSPQQRNGASATPPRFTLMEDEEEQHLAPGPPSHRPQNAFEVDLEYTGDDDALLDWEQYSRARTWRCCGQECVITAPAWWYQTSRKTRKWLLVMGGCFLSFTVLLIVLTLAAAAKKHFKFGTRSIEHACAWTDWRLPQGIAPTRYNLTFQVQMKAPWNVYGLSDVGIQVDHATRCVVMHVADLVVLEAKLGGVDGIPARRSYKEELEQLTLEWDSPIPVGYSALHMRFEYKLSQGMSGFYRSTYALPDGGSGVLATTQFEANSARKAFPCFDEPALKAEFAVEVITDVGLQVLSNMPARVAHQHAHQDQSTMTWHFQPTPPMSTYLLAIIIGDLRGVSRTVAPPTAPIPTLATSSADVAESEPSELQPRNVTVWGTPDQVEHLEYAADVAAAILPAYETAFGTAYALPKLDLVAIPDFAAGAMENWGLITYRQIALLVSPTSSVVDKRYVTKVVAHEMAHQWFGNLITLDWWNDLWLNEGFASYLEFLGAQAAHPEQSFFEFYYATDVPYALRYDSKKAAHPMSMKASDVNNTDTIESLFDPVEYERGGAVLRMLRAYMNRGNISIPAAEQWEASRAAVGPSADPFLLGLEQYLEAHKFNATTPTELWTALGGPAGLDLAPLMEAWTYQQGYPVLTVSVDAKGGVWATQAPFSLSGATPCDSTSAWWVPISFVSSEAPSSTKWAELNACQSLRPLITALPKGGWVKVNARQYGYYRVNYSSELWTAAAAAAAQRDPVTGYPVMRPVDYAGLIEDSYALAEAGMIDATVFLTNLQALPERPANDYSPWTTALNVIYEVDAVVSCQDTWRQYILRNILEPFMKNMSDASGGSNAFSSYLGTFGNEETADSGSKKGNGTAESAPAPSSSTVTVPIGQRLLRPTILRAAGFFGDPSLGQEANKLLAEASKSGASSTSLSSLSPDLRSAVYQTAVRSASDPQTAYDQIKSMYMAAKEADERDRTLRALAHSTLAVPTALEFALTSDVRAQDVPTLVVTIALGGTQEALRGTWDWFKSNWDRLHLKLGGDGEASRRMGLILERIASGFADSATIAEVDEVYHAHANKQSESGYAMRAKESITAHALWLERHGEVVCDWVENALSTSAPIEGGEDTEP